MNTFARDIASATIYNEDGLQLWQVDPLTQKVFVHSVTAILEPDEAQRLRSAFASGIRQPVEGDLSEDGQAVFSLLTALDRYEAEAALKKLPQEMKARLSAMSPMNYLDDIHAPLVILLHDRGDQVIPVGESQRLVDALNEHSGIQYTEMQFSHLDPVKGKLPFFRLLREFGKFFHALYPLFWQTVEL
jgi:hypothetical protein